MNARNLKWQGLAGILRRRAHTGKDGGGALLFVSLRQPRLRFDDHTAPARLLQAPTLRAILWIIGAHVDEKAIALAVEELLFEAVLHIRRENRLLHETHCHCRARVRTPPACRRAPPAPSCGARYWWSNDPARDRSAPPGRPRLRPRRDRQLPRACSRRL